MVIKKLFAFAVVVTGLISSQAIFAQESTEEPDEGLERTYKFSVPTDYEAGQELPLVIALHGAGGTGQSMRELTGFDEIAQREKFIIVYPDGVFGNWDFGGGVQTTEGRFPVDDIAFIEGIINKFHADYGIDKSRVYVLGFSNGAALVHHLACKVPQLFSGVAAISSGVAPTSIQDCAETPISVLMILGSEDPVLPWGGFVYEDGEVALLSAQDTAAYWALHNGCNMEEPLVEDLPDMDEEDGSTIRAGTFQECEGDTEVKLLGVIGGGHTWPGRPFENMEAGATNMDINASEEIWTWFTEQPVREQEES